MKLTIYWIGKTDETFLQEGIAKYEKRIKRYLSFHIITIPDVKKAAKISAEQQKDLEGNALIEKLSPLDEVYLLDERGEMYSSPELARFLEKRMLESVRNLVFIIGGPYGFSDKIYQRAKGTISLSKMTFSHQMVRLLVLEQVYRAFTIIKGEPYHHT